VARAALLVCVAVPASGQPVPGSGQPGQTAPAPAPQTGPTRRLSIDDAVQLALEQNLAIQVERFNPQIQDLGIAQARSAWTPAVSTTVRTDSADNPSNSFLSGGQEKVSDDNLSHNIFVQQQLPWGGNYSAAWNSSRTTTTNLFSNFDPVLRSNLDFTYVQPLLRNFGIDTARQQLLISRKNREISDIQLRDTVVTTVRNVKNAYWELVYARASLAVAQQSLELARESLRNNRTRVQVGTMAPIDIVEAEAEVARNDESVIVAEAGIDRAEDQLRALILDPSTPDFWTTRLEPTDAPDVQLRPMDIDAAVRTALGQRTDLREARATLEASDINIRYFRNQTLPDINLQADYGITGLGGTRLIRGEGFPGAVIGSDARSFGSVLGDLLQNDFPSWTLSLTVGYPIGTSTAEANHARARLQYSQAQTQIRNLELQVGTQIRDFGRQVNTNVKRVEATRSSRQLAERRLEAEQKKFSVGMSTSFLVFQAQRDLAQARNNELRAMLDYNQSLVDFEAAQEASINGGGITIQGATVAATQTGTTQTGR
jgi:outer membrane protein TolC